MNKDPGFIFETEERSGKPKRKAAYPKMIDKHFDRVLEETDALEEKLSKFDIRLYDTATIEQVVDDPALKELVGKWLGRVRSETKLLEPFDAMGIKIFCQHLDNQPAFPEVDMRFLSKKTHESRVRDLSDVGGYAFNASKTIEVHNAKPTLRHQIGYFLAHGTLDSTSSVVVHELMHINHYRAQEKEIDDVLTEAQAYLSSIIERGGSFDPHEIIMTLTKPEEDGGDYGFPLEKVLPAVQAIATLYSLGMKYDEVEKLVVESEYDEKLQRYHPLGTVAAQELKKRGLDGFDQKALEYCYRLFVTNQRLKAQLLLYQTIQDSYSVQELRQGKNNYAKHEVLRINDQFDERGQPMKPLRRDVIQNVVCPGNEEFPYDILGKRTGIIFGLVPIKKNLKAAIGRSEFTNNESVVVWAKTPKERQHYYDILREHSPKLLDDQKRRIFWDYANIGQVNTETKDIITAIIDSRTLKKILQKSASWYEREFTMIAQELDAMKALYLAPLDGKQIKKVDAYRAWLEEYDSRRALFPNEFPKESKLLQKSVASVRADLETLRKDIEYQKKFKK